MNQVLKSLRERYAHIHPLMFQRSLEKSKSNGDLFDILEGIPKEFPIIWDDEENCWQKTDNLLQGKISNKKEDK